MCCGDVIVIQETNSLLELGNLIDLKLPVIVILLNLIQVH